MMIPAKFNWDTKEKPPDPPMKAENTNTPTDSIKELNAKKRLAIKSPENKTPAKKRDQTRKDAKHFFGAENRKDKAKAAEFKIQDGGKETLEDNDKWEKGKENADSKNEEEMNRDTETLINEGKKE